MVAITAEQTEWAVVNRLRQMLAAPQGDFTTTQSFALFSSIVCWVMQHARVRPRDQITETAKAAADPHRQLEQERASDDPWCILSEPAGRIDARGVRVPPPIGFENHTAAQLLKNLRDAMAHSDARTVQPFNCDRRLVGFEFLCSEGDGGKIWRGSLVLLEEDMRRIGCRLADRYCDAIKSANESREGVRFEDVAVSIMEAAE